MRWHTASAMVVAGAVALGIATTVSARDEWNQKTYLTFSDSVELPGATLPAGKYTFRLLDSPSARNVVQIFNEDETKLIATILAVSAERRDPSDETVVTFGERAANAPPAVQYWYYPGRTIGHEFVYPREQAVRIAKATNKDVLATDAASTDAEALRQGHVTTVDPKGAESEYADRAMGADTRSTAQTAAPGSTSSTMTTPEPQTTPTPALSNETPRAATTATPAPGAMAASTARNDTQPQQPTARTTATANARGAMLPQTASTDPAYLLGAATSLLGLALVRRRRLALQR